MVRVALDGKNQRYALTIRLRMEIGEGRFGMFEETCTME